MISRIWLFVYSGIADPLTGFRDLFFCIAHPDDIIRNEQRDTYDKQRGKQSYNSFHSRHLPFMNKVRHGGLSFFFAQNTASLAGRITGEREAVKPRALPVLSYSVL